MFFPKEAGKRKLAAVMILVAMLTPLLAEGPEMEPEELVARHLEALGPLELLSALQNRTAQGVGRLEVLLGGTGSLEGPAIFVSEGRKIFFSIRFDEPNYTAEEVSFDGEDSYVGNIQPGVRSQLGQFLIQFDDLVREGLLGGVLSTAWPLLDLEGRRPRLDYEGLKKINGQELLELRYRMRKGARDFRIHLYFDPESFRHVATTYKLRISAPMGRTPRDSARQTETRITLEEWFSDFHPTDDLDLPAHWTIRLTLDTGSGTFLTKWEMIYPEITHDLSIDPQLFVLQ
ncbi:MAG: hypothetical protein O7D93_07020 [Acidobacteria bacterium]|nr:hypothetical protein [Acidobacteriota bacterium]